MAVSALFNSVTAASFGACSASSAGVASAIPMLALVNISIPCKITCPVIAWRTRSATSIATCSSPRPSHNTTNSSPPMRATMSDGRVALANRLAMVFSNWSPTLWPMLSLTSFSLSKSTNNTPTPRFNVMLRSSASLSLRKNNTRFGKPVSASCVAWKASSSCTCFASVMSRAITEKCCTAPSASRTMCSVKASVRMMPSGLRKPSSPSHVLLAGLATTSRGP